MKKYMIFMLLFAGLTISACAHQKKAGRKSAARGGKKARITAVSMTRGACFGRCPMYTVTISGDGRAVYEGRNFTEYTGTYEKRFAPAAVAPLFARFNELRPDTCQNEYEVKISDLPGLDFRLTVGGRTKEIRHAGFGPRFLSILGEEVDQAIRVDSTWKKTKDAARPE